MAGESADPSFSTEDENDEPLFVDSESTLCDDPRMGIGVRKEFDAADAWFVTPAIAALRICASGGLMPQAKHGGRGV